MRRLAVCLIIIGIPAILHGQSVVAGPQLKYSITVTGISIYPNYGYVQGFNSSGQAAYWSDLHPIWHNGYLWTGSQNVQLEPLTGADTIPQAMNDSGVIAGLYGPLYLKSTAAFWDNTGKHDLPGLGGAYTWAEAINNDNVIAGRAENGTVNIERHLVIWDNGIHDMGALPTFNDEIRSMTDARQILGIGPGELNSWVWENGNYRFLKDLQGGVYSDAFEMNQSGAVVGMSWPNQTNDRAVVWPAGSSIPQALALPANAKLSRAYDINDNNQMVGYMIDNLSAVPQAVLWQDGNYYLLNNLIDANSGWRITEGWFVNNSGQILALASSGSAGWHVLVLTPVPEPAWIVLPVVCVVSLARPRRRGAGAC
jgi:uncharacterized membrane protein